MLSVSKRDAKQSVFIVIFFFGVRVLVTFHLTCDHIIFSSVSVAEWLPLWKIAVHVLFVFLLFVMLVFFTFRF